MKTKQCKVSAELNMNFIQGKVAKKYQQCSYLFTAFLSLFLCVGMAQAKEFGACYGSILLDGKESRSKVLINWEYDKNISGMESIIAYQGTTLDSDTTLSSVSYFASNGNTKISWGSNGSYIEKHGRANDPAYGNGGEINIIINGKTYTDSDATCVSANTKDDLNKKLGKENFKDKIKSCALFCATGLLCCI